ncbi:mitochondrial carrier domain-containing protein [Dunaliella salina]|uniref:Mitochondrial carrier domain-containing protein n=1 Tax=Dunaliella salina TaxID=3046 RepID=A0ABQ7G6J5_DUNSA|nr:mitochondrial carrier domain-containing protein [Dunaliella salina]|eukprot:KAF5830214.1 mitochondrial carrier domain-containing protein [Dunaliella salina]
MDDIDWSRIDKTKFFVHGLGLFSGVTTMLFPLSVIKTRQMASHGVSGGFQGTKQTAKMVWQSEGIPGFYRGFATVVFGTIPARTIYLTSLEITKSAMQRMGKQLQLSDTTTAGVSNFAAGACASLSTQLVTVPIDVVSQRQMVHGADISSITRAASRMGSSVSSTGSRGVGGVYSGGQSGPPSSHPGGQFGVSGAQANAPASSSSSGSSCSSSTNIHSAPANSTASSSSSGSGAAHSPTQQHAHPSSSASTSSSSSGSDASSGGVQRGSPPSNSASSPSSSNPSNSRHFSSTTAANSCSSSSVSSSSSSSRSCVSVPNRGGWACSSTTGGGHVLLDRGSVWGASSSKIPGSRGGGGVWAFGRRVVRGSRSLSNGASSSSTSAAQGTQAVPSGLQIARLILKQEGLLGLYR